jgi:transglutaminase-like putative cysteine protease
MTDRDETLRRNDFWAFALLIVAGVAAQLAMWSASRRDAYLLAVPLLLLVAGASAWQRGRALAAPVRVGLQGAKLVACLGLLAYFFTSGVIVLPQHTVAHAAARPSMTAAVGGILLVVQLIQSATATTRRDLSLGAPAVCAMLTQAGVAARDAAPAPAFAVAMVAMVGGVALVYRGELLDESAAVAASKRIFVVPSVVLQVVAVAAVVFVLAPNSLQLHARPVSHTQSQGPAAPQADGGGATPVVDPHSQAIADPAAGRLDLRVRGALSNAPVFVVEAAAPAYWQGAVYDRYDGASWTMSGDSTRRPWSIDTTTTPATQRAPADQQAAGGGLQSRTDSVQIVTSQVQHVVFAPGRATTYAGPGTVSSDGDGNPRLAVSGGGPPSARDYNVVSTKPNPDASANPAIDNRDPRWLQLPADLPERVTALSHQLIGTAPSRTHAVRAVEDYLRGHATYDLDAPVPPAGEDAVDSFLFVTHQGFCEQFATAAVVLLRAAGIPTRLVTGYSQGDLASDPGRRVMRATDAHAWVQVWFPGVGWIDSDPTATSVLGKAASATPGATATPTTKSQLPPDEAATLPSSAASEAPTAAPSASPTPQPAPAQASSGKSEKTGIGRAVSSMPGGRFGAVVLVVVFLAAARLLVVMGRRRAVRRRAAPATGTTPAGGPVLQAYLRLDDALSRHGRGRGPGGTARELRSRLGGLAGLSVPAPAVAAAIDLLERECYGMEPLTERETIFAIDVFGQLLVSLAAYENTAALAGAK